MKKLELKQENERLRQELKEEQEDHKTYTKIARQNLCRTLGIWHERVAGTYRTDDSLPGWPEIYARIGELRHIEKLKDQEERLKELTDENYRLKEDLNNK